MAKDDKQTGEKRYEIQPFPLYTLRHTCLTRRAPHMDARTLAYLAGHRDMFITKRQVHPQADTFREAVGEARVARSGHASGPTDEVASAVRLGDTAATA
jgi:integrase